MTKTFCVKSDTSDSIYTVTLSKSGHNCSCQWGKYHPNGACSCLKVCSGKLSKHYCKHVEQVGDRKKSVYIDVEEYPSVLTKLNYADVLIELNEFFYYHQYAERFQGVFRCADSVIECDIGGFPTHAIVFYD